MGATEGQVEDLRPKPVVLIVDDRADKRLALSAMLAPLGLPTIEVDSGRAALEAVSRTTFAIILMDVRMPEMDGFETARGVRQTSHIVHTPIIFVTAFGNDEDEVAKAYASGAVDFIFTPVVPAILRAKVSAIVELFTQSQELHSLNTALRDGEVLTQAVLDNVADGIFVLDEAGRVESINRSASVLFGYAAGEPVGHPFDFMVAPASRSVLAERHDIHAARVAEGQGVAGPVETIGSRADGSTFAMELERRGILHAERPLTLVTVSDISERKAHTQALEHLALHDGLTGLANRALFNDLITHSIALATRAGESRGILVLDLDDFKLVNDSLGHDQGDELIKQVADRLRGAVREADVVARLGGDEFGILPADATDLAATAAIAWKIQESFKADFVLRDETVRVSPSTGIALFPDHGSDATELVHRADLAMYEAKRSGDGQTVFKAAYETETADRLALLLDLRNCVVRDELRLHFQPKVDLATGEICAVEALVRWQHPKQGLLMPASFISEVERTSLIAPVTRWVLDAALRQQSIWLKEGFDLQVAVNISARSLRHGDELVRTVAELTDRWGTGRRRLTLELTEGALIETSAPAVLGQLHEMGVQLSIDDYGVGYSSLAYLQRLPTDELKIDRSFVTTLAASPDDVIIVRSTIELGHQLGLRVVAEGVEDELTAGLLVEYRCDFAQGYFFSRPVPADELTVLLSDQSLLPVVASLGLGRGARQPPLAEAATAATPGYAPDAGARQPAVRGGSLAVARRHGEQPLMSR
jgi:diguanylate cyclase (GGDEF)-like protein/PAS domain S-box-containing protein